MTYLLLGEDNPAKDKNIRAIKDKTLKSTDSQNLDYESLHAPKVDSDILKQALIALPAVSEKRCLLIRSADKLNPKNKKIVEEFVQSKATHLVLILETDESEPKNSFFKAIIPFVKVLRFQSSVKENVFDMTNAMTNRTLVKALKILDGLMKEGNHPLKIMGGLVWYWGKSKNRISEERFQKGLKALQEADLNIKRSRLKPEYTLEVLVVKLSSLIAC